MNMPSLRIRADASIEVGTGQGVRMHASGEACIVSCGEVALKASDGLGADRVVQAILDAHGGA